MRPNKLGSFILLSSLVSSLSVMLMVVATAALAEESDGERLYRTYCTACHGLAGTGRGLNIPDMTVQARDHTDPGEMSARTDEELALAIRGGGPAVGKSVLMPAWGSILSEAQVAALIRHLHELSGTSGGTGGIQLADAPADTTTTTPPTTPRHRQRRRPVSPPLPQHRPSTWSRRLRPRRSASAIPTPRRTTSRSASRSGSSPWLPD